MIAVFASAAVDHPIYIWTGGSFADSDSSNDNYDWQNPANWSLDGAPGVPPTNAVAIIAGTVTVTIRQPVSMYSVVLTNGSILTGTNLAVGQLTMYDGEIHCSEVTLVQDGFFTWGDGSIAGRWLVSSNAVMQLVPGATTMRYLWPDTVIVNRGVMNMLGATLGGFEAIVTNKPGGVITIPRDGRIIGDPFGNDGPIRLYNEAGAVIRKTAGVGVSRVGSLPLVNGGELRADTGTLVSAPILQDGSLLSGNGRHEFSGPAARIEGTLVVSNTTVLCRTTYLQAAAPGIAAITTVDGGVFEWSEGTLEGVMNIPPGSFFRVVGSAVKIFGSNAVLNNRGTISYEATGPFAAFPTEQINNLSDGVFDLKSDATLFLNGTGGIFNNEAGGVIRKSAGTLNTFNKWTLNQRGTVIVETGEIRYSTTVNLGDGARLAGAGAHRFVGVPYFGNPATLDGDLIADGSTVVFESIPLICTNSNPRLVGTNGGRFIWGGTLIPQGAKITGTLNVASNTDLTFTASYTRLDSGTVINNSGRIILTNNARFDAPVTGADLAINNFPGSSFEIAQDGKTFSLPVQLTNQSGAVFGASATNSIPFSGAIDNWGTIIVRQGEFGSDGTIRLHQGSVISGGGRLRIAGQGAVCDGDILIDSATVVLSCNTGSFNSQGISATNGTTTISTVGNGLFEWQAGDMRGAFQFEPGSQVRVAGDQTKRFCSGSTIMNEGVWEWVTATDVVAEYGASLNATFVNKSGGFFNVFTDSAFMATPGISSTKMILFTNAGTINLPLPTSRWRIDSYGNAYFLPSSVINLGIASANSNEVPRIEMLRSYLSFGGTVNATFAPEVNLTNGSAFTIVMCGARTNEFSAVNLPSLPFPLRWRIEYVDLPSTHNVVLRVEQTPIQISATGLNFAGNLGFTLIGPAAGSCVIEISEDLQTWLPIFTNTSFGGSALFNDPSTSPAQKKFYRAILSP